MDSAPENVLTFHLRVGTHVPPATSGELGGIVWLGSGIIHSKLSSFEIVSAARCRS